MRAGHYLHRIVAHVKLSFGHNLNRVSTAFNLDLAILLQSTF